MRLMNLQDGSIQLPEASVKATLTYLLRNLMALDLQILLLLLSCRIMPAEASSKC